MRRGLSVSDNGEGMSKEALSQLFTRFFQANRQSGPGYKGSGIGLAICKALVEKMGAKIAAESEPGKGSTFRFTLPSV
jgi:two-component system OmpR family sensor kinase